MAQMIPRLPGVIAKSGAREVHHGARNGGLTMNRPPNQLPRLKVIRVTEALQRRIAHVQDADALFPNAPEGYPPIEVAKVALADELLCALYDKTAAGVARLPERARSGIARVVDLQGRKRTRRRAS